MALDKVKTGKKIKEILGKMSDTDALLLHEYYKLYKKEIPFFKRSWAAAWLLMNYVGNEVSSAPNAVSRGKVVSVSERSNSEGKADESSENTEKPAIVIIPEEESKRLFLSIGKNRRLFPREIISLIMSNTATAREDIGVIRILDNYSFVQVRDTKADEIIEKLSGIKFRGRSLTINYAKPKTAETDNE